MLNFVIDNINPKNPEPVVIEEQHAIPVYETPREVNYRPRELSDLPDHSFE